MTRRYPQSRKQARSYALTSIASGLGAIVTVVSGIILARYLTVEDRGLVALILYWSTFVALIGSFSLHEAFVLRSSQGTPLGAGLPNTLLLAGVLWALTLSLSSLTVLSLPDQFAGLDARWVMAFLGAFLFIRSLNMALVAVDQSLMNFDRLAFEQLLLPAFYTVLLMVAWLCGLLSVPVVLAVFLISRTPLVVVRAVRYRKMFIGRVTLTELRANIGIALKFHGVALLRTLAGQADKAIISLQWSLASIANFAVAFSAAGAAYSLVGQALGNISFPAASKVKSEEMAEYFSRSFRVTSILLMCLLMPILLLAPILIPLVFGAKYEGAVIYTQILAVSLFFEPLVNMVDAILRGRGEVRPVIEMHICTILLFAVGWLATGYDGILSLGFGLAISRLGALIYTLKNLRGELSSVRIRDCIFWRLDDAAIIIATVKELLASTKNFFQR